MSKKATVTLIDTPLFVAVHSDDDAASHRVKTRYIAHSYLVRLLLESNLVLATVQRRKRCPLCHRAKLPRPHSSTCPLGLLLKARDSIPESVFDAIVSGES